MAARYDLVAFDLYGTLLAVENLLDTLKPILGPDAAAVLPKWRKAQLERTWELNRRGDYEPFGMVTAVALAQVSPDLSPATIERACNAWLTVPAHPDAVTAVTRLRDAGVRCAVLSNGTAPMIRSALQAARLPIDEVRSVDEVRVYKPDPRVYALLDGIAPRQRTLFVSSNGWDVDGCKRTGRTVAYVDRGGTPPTQQPDARVTSLADLAASIIGW
ncbi:MAG TPA: haloacid dehalogenase type II [Myxococcales bacterium]|nr:haloacid dehalogenase type II [Myxococcales bacterium]